MSGSATDPALRAVLRLEAAVERLADAIGRRLAEDAAALDAARAAVPREAVAALADRMDATLAGLRAALRDQAALAAAEGGAARGDDAPDDGAPGAAMPDETMAVAGGGARALSRGAPPGGE